MIMGLNLAANEPRWRPPRRGAYVQAFGAAAIEALEIGNEPNVYSKITVHHTAARGSRCARGRRSFGYPDFRAPVPGRSPAPRRTLALAGPALAVGPDAGEGLLDPDDAATSCAATRGVRTMTVHRYPLRNCYVPPSSPQYPTIAHLLSPYSTVALAASLQRWIAIAHAQHASCASTSSTRSPAAARPGVSDTFASSLWATDALFSLLAAGVDGVNVHTLPRRRLRAVPVQPARRSLAGLGAARLLRPAAVRPGRARPAHGCSGCRVRPAARC